jgi:phosphohistidine phosphatase
MKTLYFLRHAKSSWATDQPDHLRPLKERGRLDARILSRYVAPQYKAPELVLNSDATRAIQTGVFFHDAFGLKQEQIKMMHQMYDFSGEQVLYLIKNLPENVSRVLLVGHNHAFTALVNMLGDLKIDNLPTCGFVHIDFTCNQWKDVRRGHTKNKVFPIEFKP